MKKVTLSSLCLLLCFWGAALELPQEGWRFSNGSEFPGARGALHSNTAIPFKGGKTLVLSGDFNRGAVMLPLIEPSPRLLNSKNFSFI